MKRIILFLYLLPIATFAQRQVSVTVTGSGVYQNKIIVGSVFAIPLSQGYQTSEGTIMHVASTIDTSVVQDSLTVVFFSDTTGFSTDLVDSATFKLNDAKAPHFLGSVMLDYSLLGTEGNTSAEKDCLIPFELNSPKKTIYGVCVASGSIVLRGTDGHVRFLFSLTNI